MHNNKEYRLAVLNSTWPLSHLVQHVLLHTSGGVGKLKENAEIKFELIINSPVKSVFLSDTKKHKEFSSPSCEENSSAWLPPGLL